MQQFSWPAAFTLVDGKLTGQTRKGFRGAAINRFLDETNDDPKPVIRTAAPDIIIAAIRRRHQVLDSIHYVAICPSEERPAREERTSATPRMKNGHPTLDIEDLQHQAVCDVRHHDHQN
jgi:hypothetical protein